MPSFHRIVSLVTLSLLAAGVVLIGVGATGSSVEPYDGSDITVPASGSRTHASSPSGGPAVHTAPVTPASLAFPPKRAAAPQEFPSRLFPSMPARVVPGGSFRVPLYGPVSPGAVESTAVPDAGAVKDSAERQALLASNQVLAFYGKPGAPSMGILGEYSKENLAPLLEGYAKLYDAANGDLGIVPAFYLIYGTCWPEGNIGILSRSVVEEYIQFAADRGWIVYLDHQLGKYSVEESVRLMLPFLKYPNVHLAIDPEWRTTKPMQEIGSITGAELNAAQKMVDDYLRENGLPGIRMFVVHQFRSSMIRGSEQVTANYDRVVLVHTADGFGAPALKKNTYAWNARSINMPVKGFKLFFQSKVPGAGSDIPLMKPDEVLALDPMPLVVMYQ
jgi:hypothetical protein